MKTELLIQMDGLNKSDELVFVLAASNLPWELDPAMLRRLEKRILIDLPSVDALEAMFRHHLPPVIRGSNEGTYEITTQLDYPLLARSAPGYSGSDIALVCKEAAMRVLRRVFAVLEDPSNLESGVVPRLRIDPITTEDVLRALQDTKPSARAQEKYTKWQAEFGSV